MSESEVIHDAAENDYVFMPEIKVGDEVKLNHHFIRDYKPNKDMIETIYVVIDVNDNMISLDRDVFEHENHVNRYYLKIFKETFIIIPLVESIKKAKSEPIAKIKKITSKPKVKIDKPKVKEKVIEIIPESIVKKEKKEVKIIVKEEPIVENKKLSAGQILFNEFKQELEDNTNDFFSIDVTDIGTKYIDKINKLKISSFEQKMIINKIKSEIKK
jgi:hypothetical protein